MSINKRDFIKSLVKDPAKIVWPREMKIVKTLFTIFPNDSFWSTIQMRFKLNSLCWFLSDDGRKFLNTEYKKYNLELPQPVEYTSQNNPNIKFDNDLNSCDNGFINLREFLSLWQKNHR